MARRRRPRRPEPLRFTFDAPEAPRPRRPRRRRIKWLRVSAVAFLLGLLAAVSAFFGFVTAVAQRTANLRQFRASVPQQVGYIYANDGKGHWVRIATLRSSTARVLLKAEQIPPVLKHAIVAIEDRRFYHHRGIDPEGIARAIFNHFVSGSNEGGSTITQQLIKNEYLSPQRTLKRKLNEMALAVQLEKIRSKDWILTRYLNDIYFGHGSYGVESASRYYFGRHATNVDPAQAALLAALPKSPTEFDPILHPAAALQRRNIVLEKMVEQGYLTPAAGALARQEPLLPKIDRSPVVTPERTIEPYFVQEVVQELRNKLPDDVVFGGGIKVYTTLDLRQQALAERAVKETLKKRGGPVGALASIDPRSGEVKAIVGGLDFSKSQYDLAAQARRQPGSSFKPFVYLTALQQGIRPETRFESKKVLFSLGNHQFWYVTNDLPLYAGRLGLDRALAQSDNTIYAQLTMTVGPARVAAVARKLGITSPLDPGVPAIGLGGANGVTPLEMAHAYATIANEGVRVGGSVLWHTADSSIKDPSLDPITITRVVFPGGRTIENRPRRVQVVPKADALTLLNAMKGVLEKSGTGFRAKLPDRPAAGKTGTTTGFRDAWFVGATPERATAVWVGHVQPREMKHEFHKKEVMGGTFPAILWRRFMEADLKGEPPLDWAPPTYVPESLVTVDVRNGRLAPAGCPFARELVLADDHLPKRSESSCPRNLQIVPDLTGLSEAAARRALADAGFRAVLSEVPAQPGVRAGNVLAQDPAPLAERPFRTPVLFLVPVRVPRVVVPAVTSGKNAPVALAAAVGALTSNGFAVRLVDGASPGPLNLPEGSVLEQRPRAGDAAGRGAVVTLTIVGDAHPITVPTVVGGTLAATRALLQHLGLAPIVRRADGSPPADTDEVVDATFQEGWQVPAGSQITLTTRPPAR